MKKFKDLINEVTINWFRLATKEKINEYSQNPQFEMFNNQLINLNKSDYQHELDRVLREINELENYADIVSYVRVNKMNLTNSLDLNKLQESIMRDGLKSLPNLLIKIQLGYVSELSDQFFNDVRMWQDKLGRDTTLNEIDLKDLDYLINLSLTKVANQLTDTFKTDPEVMNEIGEELGLLESLRTPLKSKRQQYQIIKIYFNKLRNSLFENLNSQMLRASQSLPEKLSQAAKNLERANALITKLEFILDYGTQLEKRITEDQKTDNQ